MNNTTQSDLKVGRFFSHITNGVSSIDYVVDTNTSSPFVAEFKKFGLAYESDLNYRSKHISIAGTNLEIQYHKHQKIVEVTGPFGVKEFNFNGSSIFELIEEINLFLKTRNKIIKGGKAKPNMNPIFEIGTHTKIKTKSDGSVEERYTVITSNISEITSNINSQNLLGDQKDLTEAFSKAREELQAFSSKNGTKKSKPGRFSMALSNITEDWEWAKPISEKITKTISVSSSVQDNIDYLFGLINKKYEQIVETGEKLQQSKQTMHQQISALESLAKDSDDTLSSYEDQSDIPIRNIATNTKIKTSVEKYKNRLLKINSSIIAMQTTIIDIGKDLPEKRSDLTEEMAIATLLSSTDDFQKMYQSVSSLVDEVVENTAENSHKVIENLLDMHIKDDKSLKYLVSTTERNEKFSSMIVEKTQILKDKTIKDANEIQQLVESSHRIEASKQIHLLSN